MMKEQTHTKKEWPCTECGGDATLAYSPSTIKRGKKKGQEEPGWSGLVQPGERLCTKCFVKRGGKSIF